MKYIQTKTIAAAVMMLALPALAQVSGTSASNPGATATNPNSGQSAGGTSPNASGPGPAAGGAVASPAQAITPGFYSTGGRVYRIERGRATPVTDPLTLRIGPDGMVGFDGRPLQIPEGQMISADGRLVPLPANVAGLPNTGTGTQTGATPGQLGERQEQLQQARMAALEQPQQAVLLPEAPQPRSPGVAPQRQIPAPPLPQL